MARRAKRIYVPLDAGFFDDDRIIEAGEQAAWLFLNILCRIRVLDTDGLITRPQLSRLGVPAWQKRLQRLVDVGLVEEDDTGIHVPRWTAWNEPRAERLRRQEAERERKQAAADKARAQRLHLVEGGSA